MLRLAKFLRILCVLTLSGTYLAAEGSNWYRSEETPLNLTNLVHNNLAGRGPRWHDPREFLWENVIPTGYADLHNIQSNLSCVVLGHRDEYHPQHPMLNGMKSLGENTTSMTIAQVNIRVGNRVRMRCTFSNPLVNEFRLSIIDTDQGVFGHEERFTTCQKGVKLVRVGENLAYGWDDDCLWVSSTNSSTVSRNKFLELFGGAPQRSEDATHTYHVYDSHAIDFMYEVGDLGIRYGQSRNFFFSFAFLEGRTPIAATGAGTNASSCVKLPLETSDNFDVNVPAFCYNCYTDEVLGFEQRFFNSTTELFTIETFFPYPMTLEKAFTKGSDVGLSVTFKILEGQEEITFDGNWSFTTNFSWPNNLADYGAWGAARVVDGKNYSPDFWGQGIFVNNTYPQSCANLYVNGTVVEVEMLNTIISVIPKGFRATFDVPTISPTDAPTVAPTTPEPTISPTGNPTTSEPTDSPTKYPTPYPTPNPTDSPTPSPTDAPTPISNLRPVAITTSSACAESLPVVNENGYPDDSEPPFFCRNCVEGNNSEWVYVYYNNSLEVLRVKTVFETAVDLQTRFTKGSRDGYSANFTISREGVEDIHIQGGRWYFSTGFRPGSGGGFPRKDQNFSADDGVWGAGGIVDGCLMDVNPDGSPAPGDVNFWGHGNYNGNDADKCKYLYLDGIPHVATNLTMEFYVTG